MIDLTPQERNALERLIRLAQVDTGQGRKVADFLLAWWNAQEFGGFDLTHLWGVDDDVAVDMIEVFKLVATSRSYPDTLGYSAQFAQIVDLWQRQPTEAHP